MRNAFTEAMVDVATLDDRVFLMVADIGNLTFDRFRAACPERFLNLGVAEANMVGIAAGLALAGKVPVVYTIASFLVMRAFEQIRDDVCYQNLNVKIVGVGGGLAYGTLGPTHHMIEDIAILRAVPNITIFSPADPLEARKVSRAMFGLPGPVYVRLAKAGEPAVYEGDYEFEVGRATILRDGRSATIVATGPIVRKALLAADRLASEGLAIRVVNMHTLKPIDRHAVLAAAAETRALVTLEEHAGSGGLGSAVAEILAEDDSHRIRFKRLALPDRFCSDYGSQDYLTDRAGLSADRIVTVIRELTA